MEDVKQLYLVALLFDLRHAHDIRLRRIVQESVAAFVCHTAQAQLKQILDICEYLRTTTSSDLTINKLATVIVEALSR